MVSVGEIFANAGLHIDTGSFSQFSSALSSVEGGIGRMSSSTVASLGAIGGAVAAAGVGLAGYAVGIGVSYEKTMTQLTGLLGSQEKAKTMFVWLQNFAATTPFEFPELAEAATKFTAAGMSATEYMTVVGDVAAGTGKSIDQVTEAFIDAQTGEWERLKELGITHTKVSEENYKQYGATMAQVGQDILTTYDANGKQMVEIFDSSSKEATNAALKNLSVEKFSGSMDAVAQSMSGKWSTIKDNINNALADIVGFKDGAIQAGSLMDAMSKLADVAVNLSGVFGKLPEPLQAAAVAMTACVVAAGLFAAGLAAYTVAAAAATAITTALNVSLAAILLPFVAIVAAAGLVVACLYVLEEKTGLVSAAWTVLKDTFTIVVDYLKTAFGELSTYISGEVTKITDYLLSLIPPGLMDAINGLGNFIKDNLGGAFTEWHTKAEAVRAKDVEVGASVDELNGKTTTGVTGQVTSLDDVLKGATTDATATTASVGAINGVSTGAVTGQIQATDNAIKAADVSGKQLGATITADGQISMSGTTGQLQIVDAKGKATDVTMEQLGTVLKDDGTISFAGTQGQLVLTDSKGKQLKLTTDQALAVAKSYNAQSLAAVRGQIDSTIARWQAASKAANDAMTVGHALNDANKAIKGSYGTSAGSLGTTTPNGVRVLPAGTKVQSTNTNNVTNIGTVNNNKPVASKTGTLKISKA